MALRRTLALGLASLASLAGASAASAHHDGGPLSQGPLAVAKLRGAAAGSAAHWCGRARTARAPNGKAAVVDAARQVEVVYALPAHQPNRFAQTAPLIQADADAVAAAVAQASDGARTVRFVRGTTCGPRYLKLRIVRLRHRAGHYFQDGLPEVGAGSPLADELDATLALPRGRDALVYVDGLGGPSAQGEADEIVRDNRPGPENRSNRGGRLAVVFGPASLPAASPAGLAPKLALHELLHAFGAVQQGAPHSTAGGHCTDGVDVMCYDDATLRSGLYTDHDCGALPGVIGAQIDCGGDDYFSPDPAPDSYLATHWNVFDSLFLGSCADPRLAPSCAGPASAPPAAPAKLAAAAAAPAGPAATAPLARIDTGASIGTVTLRLDVSDTGAVADVSATPVGLPDGDYTLVTCLTLTAPGNPPWEQCWTRQAGGGPQAFLEESLNLSRPGPGGSSTVSGRMEIRDGVGRVLAVTRTPPSLDVPAAS